MLSLTKSAKSDLAGLMFAVVFAASSGPFMAAATAPALGIAFWRNALAALILIPVLARWRHVYFALPRSLVVRVAIAGVLLGVHFSCWVPSVKITSVAAATTLIATQAIWAALFAWHAQGAPDAPVFLGIGVALLGVLLLTGVDLASRPGAIGGDLLALVAAVAAAGYMHVGRPARRHLSVSQYTAALYVTSAVTAGAVALAAGTPLWGYPSQAWGYISAVTLLAQFGGHTMFNLALRSFSATAVSLVILMQVPFGTLIAWILLQQTPGPMVLPSIALVLSGAVFVIAREARGHAVGPNGHVPAK